MGPDLLRGPLGVAEFVNADVIASGLSGLAPGSAVIQAGRIMLRRIRHLAERNVDFAYESTLASRNFAPWIGKLLVRGYEFHLVFLFLSDSDLAIARVAERVRTGGHGIPEADIRRRYERGLRNFFSHYLPIAHSWLLLDNSGTDAPHAIAWRNAGGPVQIVKNGPWEALRNAYEKSPFA